MLRQSSKFVDMHPHKKKVDIRQLLEVLRPEANGHAQKEAYMRHVDALNVLVHKLHTLSYQVTIYWLLSSVEHRKPKYSSSRHVPGVNCQDQAWVVLQTWGWMVHGFWSVGRVALRSCCVGLCNRQIKGGCLADDGHSRSLAPSQARPAICGISTCYICQRVNNEIRCMPPTFRLAAYMRLCPFRNWDSLPGSSKFGICSFP